MERLEVLEANTHSGLQILSSSPKVVFLTSMFSNAASTIRSQSAHRSSFRPGVILATIASTASWVIFPFSTSLAYPFTILALPPSAHSCLISQRATSYPSTWANAFAMPCPIVPAPIIPTFMVNPPVFYTFYHYLKKYYNYLFWKGSFTFSLFLSRKKAMPYF